MAAIKTVEVVIKDFKALKNVKADINGCNVFLRGPNRVGKSSFMDFIEIALGKSSIVPPNTNVEGQVIVDKDGNRYEFNVKLDNKGKPKVTVTLPDGDKDTSKSVIAGIVGINSFNIDDFVNLSTTDAGRKKQVEEFKKFLDEETRTFLAKYEKSIKDKYNERTDLNRDLKKLEGSIELHPMYNHVHELEIFTEIKTEDVVAGMKSVQAHNEKVRKVISNMDEHNKDIERNNTKIAELERQIAELKKDNDAKTDLNDQANEWLKTNKIKPTDEMEKMLADASKTNQDYINAQDLAKELKKLREVKSDVDRLTEEIDSEREMIKNAIRDMEGPVDGLTFDEDQLLYKGIPVHPNSLSKSDIKKLGIRLKIAENPELPLFIHEAESLDDDSLREIQELADEYDLQIFAEEVQRSKKRELKIEIVGQ